MNLVELDEGGLKFGTQIILNQASLVIRPEERACIIGRNGAGKSTLFRLILGQQQLDSGELRFRKHLRIAMLQQALPEDALDHNVEAVVRSGLSELEALLKEYEAASIASPIDEHLLARLQQAIEAQDGWDMQVKIDRIITQLQLPAHKTLRELSGGWQRRVMLGKALVCEPHLLLLDEPTNHLDIATIEWLEGHLMNCSASVVFITHDRSFLRRLATRIIELDRGTIWSWEDNYERFVQAKEDSLDAESNSYKEFDKKLAKEEVWIRQGVKARGTRNEGRVRDLKSLRQTHAARLKPQGKVKLEIQEAQPSGKTVIELKRVTHQFQADQPPLLEQLSLKIRRGDRIGIIGNNGVGKTTLLRILLGELQPNDGIVKLGTNLEPAFFDQMRRRLEMERSVAYNVANGKDYLILYGKERHVIGYLKNFLFSPETSQTPMNALSGGEINRVLLAKICAKPSNLMVLDEPTNDLDLELLEVLETAISKYQGTLIVVSHDREFLDAVVDSILVFEADGKIHHYKGGYSQWANQHKRLAIADTPIDDDPNTGAANTNNQSASAAARNSAKARKSQPKKVSYKIQREYELVPKTIEQLEAQLAQINKTMANPEFYSQKFDDIQPILDEQADLKSQLDKAMNRWLELEEMIND